MAEPYAAGLTVRCRATRTRQPGPLVPHNGACRQVEVPGRVPTVVPIEIGLKHYNERWNSR